MKTNLDLILLGTFVAYYNYGTASEIANFSTELENGDTADTAIELAIMFDGEEVESIDPTYAILSVPMVRCLI